MPKVKLAANLAADCGKPAPVVLGTDVNKVALANAEALRDCAERYHRVVSLWPQ